MPSPSQVHCLPEGRCFADARPVKGGWCEESSINFKFSYGSSFRYIFRYMIGNPMITNPSYCIVSYSPYYIFVLLIISYVSWLGSLWLGGSEGYVLHDLGRSQQGCSVWCIPKLCNFMWGGRSQMCSSLSSRAATAAAPSNCT